MTEEEMKLWKAIDQINGQIELARTYYYDNRLCAEPAFTSIEGIRFEAALNELVRYGARARLELRKIIKK